MPENNQQAEKMRRSPLVELQNGRLYIYATCPSCESVNKGDITFITQGDSKHIDFSFTCRICGKNIPITIDRSINHAVKQGAE